MTKEKSVEEEMHDLADALIRILHNEAPKATLDAAEELRRAGRALAHGGGEQEELDLYTAAIAFNIALKFHGA